MTLRKLGFRIDHVAAGPRADGEDRARALAGADENVLRPRRAVHEVPGSEPPLLSFDEQQALARKHEEVLLFVLAVVHAGGLARG